MRWIVDTSAWSRRGQQKVADQLRAVVRRGDELAFSPPVLIEVLRGPQVADVAEERAKLTADVPVLPVSPDTFELAAGAMEQLAEHSADGHRVPIPDLLTAVIAHEHGAGVLHCDGPFALLSEHAGLSFPEDELEFDAPDSCSNPAARQRELKKQLNQTLHLMPIDEAEKLLEAAVQQARSQAARYEARGGAEQSR